MVRGSPQRGRRDSELAAKGTGEGLTAAEASGRRDASEVRLTRPNELRRTADACLAQKARRARAAELREARAGPLPRPPHRPRQRGHGRSRPARLAQLLAPERVRQHPEPSLVGPRAVADVGPPRLDEEHLAETSCHHAASERGNGQLLPERVEGRSERPGDPSGTGPDERRKRLAHRVSEPGLEVNTGRRYLGWAASVVARSAPGTARFTTSTSPGSSRCRHSVGPASIRQPPSSTTCSDTVSAGKARSTVGHRRRRAQDAPELQLVVRNHQRICSRAHIRPG